MKYAVLIICLMALVICFMPSKAEASEDIDIDKHSLLSPLVSIYNELISTTKSNISRVMNKLQRPISALLASFMAIWLVVMALRSIMTGNSLRDAILSKLGLFVALNIFLQFRYFSTYIVGNLEALFNNLPVYITALGGNVGNEGDILENILKSAEATVVTIGNIMSDSSFSFGYVLVLVGGLMALASIIAVTIQVVTTSLVATIKFYLVLSLSSIWVLLFFFRATRIMAMQAINVIIECICQMCLLVAVLGLSSSVFIKLLSELNDSTTSNIWSAYIGIVIVSAVDIFLINESNRLAGKIASAGSLSTGGDLVKDVVSRFSIKGNKL